jgi:hypothetical protein
MMQIRNDIISKIVNSMPDNVKPTEYIMRTLGISKGSAYRRLKGTLPFTYDEIAILAHELEFSVDEVINSSSRIKYIFEFGDYFNDSPQTIILKALTDYCHSLSVEQKMKRRNVLVTTNNLWFVYTLFFDNLFKYFYYKYMQQSDISFLKEKMKDIEIPQSIIDIRQKLMHLISTIDNTYKTSIFDRHIFLNTMSEVQYYYRRNLIDDKELNEIIEDIKLLLNIIEKEIVENGYSGDKNQYFVAERNIYTNSASIENDKHTYALIFQNNVHPMACTDQNLCRLHRQYLESHKKQSRLISSSNEQLQIAFFEKQYGYIRALAENKDLMVSMC